MSSSSALTIFDFLVLGASLCSMAAGQDNFFRGSHSFQVLQSAKETPNMFSLQRRKAHTDRCRKTSRRSRCKESINKYIQEQQRLLPMTKGTISAAAGEREDG